MLHRNRHELGVATRPALIFSRTTNTSSRVVLQDRRRPPRVSRRAALPVHIYELQSGRWGGGYVAIHQYMISAMMHDHLCCCMRGLDRPIQSESHLAINGNASHYWTQVPIHHVNSVIMPNCQSLLPTNNQANTFSPCRKRRETLLGKKLIVQGPADTYTMDACIC